MFLNTKNFLIVFCALFFESISLASSFRHSHVSDYSPLINNANIDCVIDIGLDAPKERKEAAKFLSECLLKISETGKVQILASSQKTSKFLITLRQNPDFKPITPGSMDEENFRKYIFNFKKNAIEIFYPEEKNAMNAVGYFLKTYCGCKFFTPYELGWEIPKQKVLKFKLRQDIFIPSFLSSTLALGGGAAIHKFSMLNGFDDSLLGYIHSPDFYFAQKDFDEHPEYFARLNNKRLSPVANKGFFQPDYANWNLKNFYLKKIEQYFKKFPNKYLFSISPADSNGFDESSRTMDSASGYYRGVQNFSEVFFPFLNDLAEDLKKTHPDKFLYSIAYRHYLAPPHRKLSDNIAVYIATDRTNFYNLAYKSEDEKLLRDWANSGVKLWGVYDYFYGSMYFVPRHTPKYIYQSIKNAHLLGAKIYFAEVYPFYPYDAPKIWLLSNLLQDAKSDPDKILKDYFCAYYKESANHVEVFFEIAQVAWLNRSATPIWLTFYKRESAATLFSYEVLDAMQSALDCAKKSAKTEIVKKRLDELEFAFKITKTYCYSYFVKQKLWALNADSLCEVKEILRLIKLNIFWKKQKELIKAQALKYAHTNPINTDFWRVNTDSDPTLSSAIKVLRFAKKSNNTTLIDEVKLLLTENEFTLIDKIESNFTRHFNNDFKDSIIAPTAFFNWKIVNTPRENAKIEFKKINTNIAVEFSNINSGGIYKNIPATSGKVYEFSCDISGTLRDSTLCYLRMVFSDSSNKTLLAKTLILPIGKDVDYKSASIITESPQSSAQLSVGLFFTNMDSADLVTAKHFSLKIQN